MLRKINYTLIAAGLLTTANAAVISVNFNNTAGPNAWVLTSTDTAGPIASANWNNVTGASNTSGITLNDDAGTATTASMTWSSANIWTSGVGNGSNDKIILHPYLDDGSGVTVTVTNIPFAQYNVYGIIANADGSYTSTDFNVNNGTWAFGGSAAADGLAQTNIDALSGSWVQATTTTRGNYWKVENQADSTLSIQGIARGFGGNAPAQRGSLAGIVIEEVPEPASALLLGFGGLALLFVRRK